MELGDRLGLAGLVVALFGIAVMYLWPTKKWIGWLSLGLAIILCGTWAVLEIESRFKPERVVSDEPPSAPKIPSASEIAEELAKRSPKPVPPRSHISVMDVGFNLGAPTPPGPVANVAFTNDGKLDAHYEEFARIATDWVFFDDPVAQRKIEDDQFQGMLSTMKLHINATVLQIPRSGKTFMSSKIPVPAKQIEIMPQAVYFMGRLSYWDNNGKHYSDWCFYIHNRAEPVFQCKEHNQAP